MNSCSAGAQLLGRVTYEGFAAAWPSREGEFADKLNNDPKYVVSTTLENPTWQNTTVISQNVPEEIAKVKAATEGTSSLPGAARSWRRCSLTISSTSCG